MSRMLNIAVGIATCVGVWVTAPSAARACSCTPPKPPVTAMRRADVVFEGKTRRPVPAGNQVRYTFEVTRVFKGNVGRTVDIYTAIHSAACGRRFQADTPYLVYARTSGSGNGRLGDGLCSRTRTSAKASEDFMALGAGRATGMPADPVPVDDDLPTTEPPRIEPSPTSHGPHAGGPPAQSPPTAKRGCSVAGSTREMPHGRRTLWLAGFGVLVVAGCRRRSLR